MAFISKKRKVVNAKVDVNKSYTLKEASTLVKSITTCKFDASVDLHVRLGVDPKKADQAIRGTVTLPHGTKKKKKVLVLCTPDKEAEAKEAHKIAVTAAVAEAFTDAGAMPRTQAALVSEALASELTVEQAKEAAVEAAAELASASGAGKPAGVGNTIGVAEAATEPTDADILTALKGA